MAKRTKSAATDAKVAERRAARKAAQQATREGTGAAADLRVFEGLPAEPDWVALREVVPAATATVRTSAEHGGVDVTVVTLLPRMWAAVRRDDGQVLVALQTASSSGDASRDVAAALLQALDVEAGTAIEQIDLPDADAPRLQDVLDPTAPFEITLHDDFGYTLPESERDADVEKALEESGTGIVPTARLTGVDAAYWCRMGEREFLRWARPEEPEALLDGLARLHAARSSALDDGSRFVGAFRSCGLLVPVWELAPGTEAADVEPAAAAFAPQLAEAVSSTAALTPQERRARAGLVSRQVSLR